MTSNTIPKNESEVNNIMRNICRKKILLQGNFPRYACVVNNECFITLGKSLALARFDGSGSTLTIRVNYDLKRQHSMCCCQNRRLPH
jgi:hypothetical protein